LTIRILFKIKNTNNLKFCEEIMAIKMNFGTEKMYHIGISKEDLQGAKYALLPGDPARVEKIAKFLTDPVQIGKNREYTSYLATLENEKVLVMSTGMGGPSTAIGAEELIQLGISNLIRIGTSGGMQLNVMPGDVCVINGAIRQEGTSREYMPIEYPAIADFDITTALCRSAKRSGYGWHVGVAHCKDSFYGQHSPETMPVSYELENKWKAWIESGALCSEMETAALFTVAQVRRVKAGAVMLVIWNQEREAADLPQERCFDTERAIKVAVDAIKILINQSK
jgi:uridine phosphorylase